MAAGLATLVGTTILLDQLMMTGPVDSVLAQDRGKGASSVEEDSTQAGVPGEEDLRAEAGEMGGAWVVEAEEQGRENSVLASTNACSRTRG